MRKFNWNPKASKTNDPFKDFKKTNPNQISDVPESDSEDKENQHQPLQN